LSAGRYECALTALVRHGPEAILCRRCLVGGRRPERG
jgi:hypothetical protein